MPAPAVEGWFEVAINSVTSPLAPGEQGVLTAWTAPGAICTVTFMTTNGTEPLTRTTTADTRGFAFWLWSSERDFALGTATADVSCGATPASVSIEMV